MAIDLLVAEAPDRALYSVPFQASRPFVELEMTMSERLQRCGDYLAVPEHAKPFGYAYELDFAPSILAAEHERAAEFAEHYYDAAAQIWSTSHHEIHMQGVYTYSLVATWTGCGYVADRVISDAC